MQAGDRLRDIRKHLGISIREVEESSKKVAHSEGNSEYIISNAWLAQIENSDSTPSIYKLFTLSIVYRTKFSDLLMLYGIDLNRIPHLQTATPLTNTHLAQVEIYDRDRTLQFPVRFDTGFSIQKTNLIARMVEIWGEVPIGLIQNLNLKKHLYGFIGLSDNHLFPLLRPGSFVQIDTHQTRIQKPPWKSEFDRPIYFIELRDRYICAWCELHDKTLYVIPHPQSGYALSQYAFPNEANVVGRVSGVAMRIIPADESSSAPLPAPKQV